MIRRIGTRWRRLRHRVAAAWIILLALLVMGGAQAQDLAPYAGDWEGELQVGGTTLPLVLHVMPEEAPEVTLDSPMQGAFGLPGEAAPREDGALDASWSVLGARYEGRLTDDGAIDGTFSQSGATFPLRFEPAEAAPSQAFVPPQDAPYEAGEMGLVVPGTGVTLSGTLTLPEGEGPFPGLVLISGSGPQDRDETLFGRKPFAVLADGLAREGIATYRYDDRGVGGSTGSFEDATSRDFAADAEAALDALRARPEIGAAGFLGHSEGGIVAGLAAAERDADPDMIALLASPFEPMDAVLERQSETMMRQMGLGEAASVQNMALQRRLLAAAMTDGTREEACAALARAARGAPEPVQNQAGKLCTPWFYTLFRIDPAALYAQVDAPVLALFGERDSQVDAAANAQAAEAAGVKSHVFEGLNHLFQKAETGAISEYAQAGAPMAEGVIAALAAFTRDAAQQ